jgi:hypothetical protein
METFLERFKRENIEEKVKGFTQGKGLVFKIEPGICRALAINLLLAAESGERTHLVIWPNGLARVIDHPYEVHYEMSRM